MNEEPKEDVARREQSKELEGMMDGWMDGCTTAAKGEKKLVLPSSEREMGSYGVVRYSTPEVKEAFLAPPALLERGVCRPVSGPSASAAAARAVPARPASSRGSAIVAR